MTRSQPDSEGTLRKLRDHPAVTYEANDKIAGQTGVTV